MSQTFTYLIIGLGMFGYWYWQQKRLRDAGGAEAVLEQVDQQTFDLQQGEAIARRWDAAFYLGKLLPETLPTFAQRARQPAFVPFRGRPIRIALTTTNRIVFSVDRGLDREDSKIAKGAVSEFATAFSKGFSPVATIDPDSSFRIVAGEKLFGQHEAWPETIKRAPSAMIDSRNWEARARTMTVARLENMPDGRAWTVWIDPEALQFLSNYGRTRAPVSTAPAQHD
jgi:hypothetical protein